MPKTLMERFEEKYDIHLDTGCWVWTALLNKDGYGRFWMDGKDGYAHRAAWIIHNGHVPYGLCICHTCDNPACVNPKHLFAGTIEANQADKAAKGRGLSGERQPHSKLVEADVLAIRNDTRSQQKIAEQYGVSQSQISNIKLGRDWKHI